MARIALKIDVDTLRGTQEGVPRLLRALDRAGVRATFLFSLGPDHTGRALRRVLRPGFLSKVSRTSVTTHYGWRTLLYGVLLPGPDIGKRAAGSMRSVQLAGHECGIHSWDHVLWQDNVRRRGGSWTVRQMQFAFERFVDVFKTTPTTHGAAGWQMNADAFRQIDRWGFAYASDGRGTAPFVPSVEGRRLAHVQLPTTLPTLDELIGIDGVDPSNVADRLLALTTADRDQVHTLHAELEGGALTSSLEDLLAGWHAQGHRLGNLADTYSATNFAAVPTLPVAWSTVPGRSGEVVVPGPSAESEPTATGSRRSSTKA